MKDNIRKDDLIRITAISADETRVVGEKIGRMLTVGDVVCLSGELGAGKTTIVKGIVNGLGVKTEAVSPTFTIVNEYGGGYGEENGPTVFHFDAYRLGGSDEMEEIGFEDYFDRNGVILIEWPERIAGLIPENAVRIRMDRDPDPDKEEVRLITIEWKGRSEL
jgi:tRNA threonylcarbamoyladenosine biosynthesis protein TsaE